MVMSEELVLFSNYLKKEEKSDNTIQKYVADAKKFIEYKNEKQSDLGKEMILDYKMSLLNSNYKISSVNSMLAALNSYLAFLGRGEMRVKYVKTQRKVFRDERNELSREEYFELVECAVKQKKEQLSLIIQTIASTGIRVSELRFVTVEAVNERKINIRLKGKDRMVLLPDKLCELLTQFINNKNIKTGSVFLTKNKNAISRCDLYRQMKLLCRDANVDPEKVFPHNFRHFFALTFYNNTGDIVHLADILGHSNINTTRIYTKCPLDRFRDEINNMELIV